MPATSVKMQQAAGAELARRKRGVKRLKRGNRLRPFGTASLTQVRDFAATPTSGLPQRRNRLQT